MRATGLLLMVVGLTAGCPPEDQYDYGGYIMESFFPFDGDRTWEFVSTDTSISWKLVGTLEADVEELDSYDVRTITYVKECVGTDETCVEGEFVFSLRLSSSHADGVHIHGYDDGSGAVSFEPPIELAQDKMKVDSVATTETGGATWTSTFIAVESCPVQWTDAWDECVHLHLDDGGAGAFPAGHYWAVTGYNIVTMQFAGGTDQWQLLYATYSSSE